jgi:hypothetical protein
VGWRWDALKRQIRAKEKVFTLVDLPDLPAAGTDHGVRPLVAVRQMGRRVYLTRQRQGQTLQAVLPVEGGQVARGAHGGEPIGLRIGLAGVIGWRL